jgi:hypothetical protein
MINANNVTLSLVTVISPLNVFLKILNLITKLRKTLNAGIQYRNNGARTRTNLSVGLKVISAHTHTHTFPI